MRDEPKWLTYNQAIKDFSRKFVDPNVAVSLFNHCLEEGFIRARCEGVQRPSDATPRKRSIPGLVALDGSISTHAWDHISFEAPFNIPEDGSFALSDPWEDRTIAKIMA